MRRGEGQQANGDHLWVVLGRAGGGCPRRRRHPLSLRGPVCSLPRRRPLRPRRRHGRLIPIYCCRRIHRALCRRIAALAAAADGVRLLLSLRDDGGGGEEEEEEEEEGRQGGAEGGQVVWLSEEGEQRRRGGEGRPASCRTHKS